MFNEDKGTFIIYGFGPMKNYTETNEWSEYREKIKKIQIIDGITTIGSFAFHYNNNGDYGYPNIESLEMPNSITHIYKAAFSHCEGLKHVTWSKELIYIDDYAFDYCSIQEMTSFPPKIQTIGLEAFSHGCLTETISIPKSLKLLGSSVFFGWKNLKTVNIEIQNTEFRVKNNVLFDKVFQTILLYPAKREGEEYVIPTGIKTLNPYSFSYASNLKSLRIPSSVTSIGSN